MPGAVRCDVPTVLFGVVALVCSAVLWYQSGRLDVARASGDRWMERALVCWDDEYKAGSAMRRAVQ